MYGRARAITLAVLMSLLLGGCVYYNTFYHAKTAFREAESLRESRPPDSKPSAQEKKLLERVVEKSGRVLKLHPDSDWADDALLLLGRALYRQGKYESAEGRLTGFLGLYPESELLPEATYTLAAVHLSNGNAVAAEEALETLAFADPPHPLSADALTLVGEARHARERYGEAAEAYRAVLDQFPSGARRAEVRILLAENYVEMGQLEEAARELEALENESGSRIMILEGRLRLAEVRLELGETESAMAVLEDLERRTTDRDELDRVLLLKGRTLESRDEFDEAVSTYEGVAVSHPRSVASAEARYRIGTILRDELGDLEGAAESFRLAKNDAPRDPVGKLASRAVGDLAKLEEFLGTIDRLTLAGGDAAGDGTSGPSGEMPELESTRADSADTVDLATGEEARPAAADTTGEPPPDPAEQLAGARLRVAEIYLLRFDDPERALPYYEAIRNEHAESGAAPKAALAIAWIMEHRISDREAAIEAYRAVLRAYPGSEYAEAAGRAIERLGDD